jgi:CheY-like chemotaxis protein
VRRVLLVDEDPMVRLAVDRQLDTLGWDAVVVNSGEEAIRVIEMGLFVDVSPICDCRISTAGKWRGRSAVCGRSRASRSWAASRPVNRWNRVTRRFC